MISGRGTGSRWARGAAALLAGGLALAALAVPARADVPVEDDSSEAQLMGFYAAALSFTPLGNQGGAPFEAGIEATYLPSLSEEDRETTFAGAKVQNTNYTNVLPRPRVRWRPTERWLAEVGFIPPVELFGVTPEQYAAAVAFRVGEAGREIRFWSRGHYLYADIEGPITCPEDATEDVTNTVCYGGQESADHFRPESYGLDLVVEGPRLFADTVAWYAAAGWEHQTLRFQTHFVNIFGRLDDQALVARVDRASILGGVTWNAGHGLRLVGEASYMPDALFTARVGLSWGWGTP
jgi:hypothetical protein